MKDSQAATWNAYRCTPALGPMLGWLFPEGLGWGCSLCLSPPWASTLALPLFLGRIWDGDIREAPSHFLRECSSTFCFNGVRDYKQSPAYLHPSSLLDLPSGASTLTHCFSLTPYQALWVIPVKPFFLDLRGRKDFCWVGMLLQCSFQQRNHCHKCISIQSLTNQLLHTQCPWEISKMQCVLAKGVNGNCTFRSVLLWASDCSAIIKFIWKILSSGFRFINLHIEWAHLWVDKLLISVLRLKPQYNMRSCKLTL